MKPLTLYILDVVRSLIMEGAKYISVMITESRLRDHLIITVAENPGLKGMGKGCMNLDFSLLKYEAEVTGGSFDCESDGDKPAKLTALFRLSHPDRQPLGDIAGLLTIMIAAHPEVNFNYTHSTDFGIYRFSTQEIKKLHKVETLRTAELLNTVGYSINENLTVIKIADTRI